MRRHQIFGKGFTEDDAVEAKKSRLLHDRIGLPSSIQLCLQNTAPSGYDMARCNVSVEKQNKEELNTQALSFE